MMTPVTPRYCSVGFRHDFMSWVPTSSIKTRYICGSALFCSSVASLIWLAFSATQAENAICEFGVPAETRPSAERCFWGDRRDLDPQLFDYKSNALALSYGHRKAGTLLVATHGASRQAIN